MFKFIKNIVGFLSEPNETIYKCELGDYWVAIDGLPTLDGNYKEIISYEHQFNYQKIKQNKYGKWKRQYSYWGKNFELPIFKV